MTTINVKDTMNFYKDNQVSLLGDAVVEGMMPWRPKTVEFWVDYDIDFNNYRIVAEARGDSWNFYHTILVDRDDILDGEDWVWRAYPEIVQGFRHRTIEPENNILLGED